MDCVPAGLKLVVISRNDHAPEMVRRQANRLLKLVEWQDLAFTEEEFQDVILQAGGQMPLNPPKSHKCCEQAFEKFAHISDYFGQVLSFAAAVESFFILRGNILGLDRWIGEGVRLSNQLDSNSDGEISGRFTAAMLAALTIRDPKHPAIVS